MDDGVQAARARRGTVARGISGRLSATVFTVIAAVACASGGAGDPAVTGGPAGTGPGTTIARPAGPAAVLAPLTGGLGIWLASAGSAR